VLLHLGDHPAVGRRTIERLLRAAAANPDRAVLPESRGRGGHPVLIPPRVAALILAHPLERGLREYWLGHPEHCVRLEVTDPGILLDLDRPSGSPG
jgi:molybdenum cofactor cytidylyltransferase